MANNAYEDKLYLSCIDIDMRRSAYDVMMGLLDNGYTLSVHPYVSAAGKVDFLGEEICKEDLTTEQYYDGLRQKAEAVDVETPTDNLMRMIRIKKRLETEQNPDERTRLHEEMDALMEKANSFLK